MNRFGGGRSFCSRNNMNRFGGGRSFFSLKQRIIFVPIIFTILQDLLNNYLLRHMCYVLNT